MAYAVKHQFIRYCKMVNLEKRKMAGLFLKVKWLCAANCIAAGHLALGYFYLVVAGRLL